MYYTPQFSFNVFVCHMLKLTKFDQIYKKNTATTILHDICTINIGIGSLMCIHRGESACVFEFLPLYYVLFKKNTYFIVEGFNTSSHKIKRTQLGPASSRNKRIADLRPAYNLSSLGHLDSRGLLRQMGLQIYGPDASSDSVFPADSRAWETGICTSV